ncbi:MAG: hypothetical protein FJY85_18540, partial [Deltaproteobacteria bacterium]|nr:hypothetical protein [Deltaproteobacteria bacterium]
MGLGYDEVATLASSFNHMVARLKDYTSRLEAQTIELERAHNQTRTFCDIVREIGALLTLYEIGPALIKRFQRILLCRDMALLIVNDNREGLFVMTENEAHLVTDGHVVHGVTQFLEETHASRRLQEPLLKPPLVPDFFVRADRQAIIPVKDKTTLLGALAVACQGSCPCDMGDARTTAVTGGSPGSPTLEETEKMLLQQALLDCSWNKKEAARRLGIGRSTLYAKLKKYGF